MPTQLHWPARPAGAHESIHALANPRSNAALAHLCETLNAMDVHYPGTALKLRYEAPNVA